MRRTRQVIAVAVRTFVVADRFLFIAPARVDAVECLAGGDVIFVANLVTAHPVFSFAWDAKKPTKKSH